MRILYLATADARGHLMRGQLLAHYLQARGDEVEVLTTSRAGVDFLASFGITSTIFTRFYYVEFDQHQNMRALATDWRVIRYFFYPWHMLSDIWRLKQKLKHTPYDLIINDSLHPALIAAPFFGIKNIVHIHGETLRQALNENFKNRLPSFLAKAFGNSVNYFLDKAKAQLIHSQDIELPETISEGWRLPNPVQAPNRAVEETWLHYGFNQQKPLALIYLNPHFQDEAFVARLEQLFYQAGWQFMGISESYAQRPNWHKYTDDFANLTFAADLLVTAGGMAALRLAKLNGCPLLALSTAQPEQQNNLMRFKHDAPYFALLTNSDPHWQQAVEFIDTLKNNPPSKPSLTEVQAKTENNIHAWLQIFKQLSHSDSVTQEYSNDARN